MANIDDLRRLAGELELILRREPNHAQALHDLGVVQHQLGNNATAIELLERAVQAAPGVSSLHYNLGTILRRDGQFQRALGPLLRAAELKPDDAQVHNALGGIYRELGRLTEAHNACLRAAALRPDHAPIYMNLGSILQQQARLDEAIASYRRAVELQPGDAAAHSALLLCMNYHDAYSHKEIFEQHLNFARRFAVDTSRPRIAPSPNGRIRIGYVSPDFRRHSVAFFIWPILAAHDRDRFEITCYSDVLRPDPITALIQPLPQRWRQVAGLPDNELARLVAEDQIDILVDLAGHTAGNRLPMFARKCAPVQATYLGYPNTTGLSAMDWRITDAIADPPGESDALHSEKLMRLPGCAWCYQAPADAPESAAAPATRNGFITFGSFNNFAKVSPTTVRLWAGVLNAMPTARLVIKSNGLDDLQTAQNVAGRFAQHGISPDRLLLLGRATSFADHLHTYAQIDIALDTFPYHGTTTTCEALWMGVPLVTPSGSVHRSRTSQSILTQIGLSELVAENDADFVRIATQLANDLSRLASIRDSLRARMLRSPLLDAKQLTRNLETAYVEMFKSAQL